MTEFYLSVIEFRIWFFVSQLAQVQEKIRFKGSDGSRKLFLEPKLILTTTPVEVSRQQTIYTQSKNDESFDS